jgi:multidrug efflux pump subunit AcrA (membrane-fusion protein)
MYHRTRILVAGLALLAVAPLHAYQAGPTPEPAGEKESSTPTAEELERIRLALPPDLDARSSRAELWSELLKTAVSTAELREALANSQTEVSMLRRELGELRQFILDHEEFGDDYEEYNHVREVAERELKRRNAQKRREQLDQERAAKKKGRDAEELRKKAEELARIREEHYTNAGFETIGMGLYMGRSAFFYAPKDLAQAPLAYNPYQARTQTSSSSDINYSEMTISGSVVNGTSEVRNIGVAITFFDEYGNQIGAETVQVENARPNVPYPFTRKLQMALNRPFASHVSYVLYSDIIQ